MPFRHEPDQPVRQQGPHHQVLPLLRAARALVAEGEGHVAVAVAQHPHGAGRLGLLQGDPGAGVGVAQGGEGGRHECGAAAGERHQPDPSGAQPGDGRDLFLRGGEPGEDARRVPHQRVAGLGQPHLAAGADEQRRAGGRLQGLHLLADGGLGAPQFTGGGGEGTGGGHGAQHAEVAGFDHTARIRTGISLPLINRGLMRRRFDVHALACTA